MQCGHFSDENVLTEVLYSLCIGLLYQCTPELIFLCWVDIDQLPIHSWQEVINDNLSPLALDVESKPEDALVVAHILTVPFLVMSVWDDLEDVLKMKKKKQKQNIT